MSPLVQLMRESSPELAPQETGIQPHLPRLPGVRHLVFDIYGTLLISGAGDPSFSHDREIILRSLLSEHKPLPPFSLVTHLHNLIAQSQAHSRKEDISFPEVNIRDVWTRFFASLHLPAPERLDEFIVRYELAINPVSLMPDALALLEHPATIGLISNAQFYTPLLFEAFSLPLPKHYLLSFEHGHAKPGTFLFEQLSEHLSPSETLYIGNDLLNDIAPAHQTGFKTALFAGDQRSLRLRQGRSDLPRPDAIVTSLAQIPSIIGE